MSESLTQRDAAHRERALDVTQSFLVQAPAGAGKTELLIQRFLALLAHVERPERIVAMTFTRKAAGEMRERITAALRDAEQASPVSGAHERRTRDLALAALSRDRACGWELVAHPARLQVHTIDALCASIARQAPVTAKLGAMPRFEEQSMPLLRRAVRAALDEAAAGDAAWRQVLSHLDNDAAAAVDLLAAMLARRDQWLKHLVGRDPAALRAQLERALGEEIAGELARLCALFPDDVVAEACALLGYAAANLAADPREAGRAALFAQCAARGGLPAASAACAGEWVAVADWLLRKDAPQFRRTVNASDGFPPQGKGADAATRGAHKARMLALLGRCAEIRGLADALAVTRRLPPAAFDTAGWAFVAAMLDLLPRLAARLTVTFAEAGAIDFAQAMLAALDALGEPDAPSDLLLRLDLGLDHLLVDEYQDTSDAQNALIERLTAGWQTGDGRTLFAVGDPMQSIYRFREAEVRLFLRAQEERRIGGIDVAFLDLARNFRSQANVVAWVNATFPQVLAARDDPWRSAVAYAPAAAVRAARPGVAPTVDVCADPAAEARCVVRRVQDALRAGAPGVAILVRARAHLAYVLPALRDAQVPFAAVDLESLADRQAVQDLLSLTHALVQPADRLAWLALLRAPWCGLALPDLFVVAGAAAESDWEQALRSARVAGALTPDGAARLARLATAVLPALAERGRTALAPAVRAVWLALGGPACLDDAADLAAADRFFALLATHARGAEIADYDAFVDALDNLKAAPDDAAGATVQLMTLHRAKGLQFDTVILPGLAQDAGRADNLLLRWRMRPQGLLLAPARRRGAGTDAMYRYLGGLDRDEASAELGRLLYVGCTRAQERLHLTATLALARGDDGTLGWKAPPAGSALAKLLPALEGQLPPPEAQAAVPAAPAFEPPLLRRLPLAWRPPDPAPAVPLTGVENPAEPERPAFDWAQATAAAIGTVAHRMLARVAQDPGGGFHAAPSVLAAELAFEGVDAADLAAAVATVTRVVANALGDPRGRWLFDPAHAEAASELALAGFDEGRLVHVTLDRTFVADGVRWIVDFKTGAHAGGDPQAFLDREVERYRGQLARYARIVRGLDARPIRLALYYPLVPDGWREWDAA